MNITGNTKGGDLGKQNNEKPFIALKKNIEAASQRPKFSKTKNIAKLKEQGEQPVHPIKKEPKEKG